LILRYWIGCIILCAVQIQAESFSELQVRLAHEFNVSQEELNVYQKWLNQKVQACSDPRIELFEARLTCMREALYRGSSILTDSVSVNSIESLMPSQLIKENKGGEGVYSFSALILAEHLGLRVTPVMLPEHIYLRFSNGRNWDPLDSGIAITDDAYRKRDQLDPGTGRSAKSMSEVEYEGWIRFQIASALDVQGSSEKSEQQLRIAQMLWADPRVPIRLALVQEERNHRKEGLHVLDSLWNWGARSEELVWTKAMMMVRSGTGVARIFQFVEDAIGRRIESGRLIQLRDQLAQGLAAE